MYLNIMGKPTDEELVKYALFIGLVFMNGTLQFLTTAILKLMKNQSGLVIHNI